MPWSRRYILILFWLGLVTTVGAQTGTSVVIVSSERGGAYGEAAEALINELERGGLSRNELTQVTVAEYTQSEALSPKLYIALGTEAARALAMAEVRVPVLCTLLPRSSFERILRVSDRKASSQFSALYLDQPLSRQLELIQLALPGARRIGVLWGGESLVQAPALRALASSNGLQLVEVEVGLNELIFPGLKRVLEGSDVLLAMADPQVFNSSTVQNILLSSFRARIPMVAFSPAYARAGALLALYATPAQLGRQAGTLARGVLQGKPLSSTPLYSQNFSVTVNGHVARSLGLNLDADALSLQLRRREGMP